MAKRKVGKGIYVDTLKSGKNYYARFELHHKTEFVNLTREYGITTLPQAKKKRVALLIERQSPDADFIKNNKPVTDFIEAYIAERPTNERNPNRSQRKIVQNRYDLYIKPHLKHVRLGKLSIAHINAIKSTLEKRKVGKSTYEKVQTLICSSLKGTGINCTKLFNGFEPADKTLTVRNKKKYKVDEYFSDNPEDVVKTFYTFFLSQFEQATEIKRKDTYAFLLYLLLTASRSGEAAQLKIKDVKLFDKNNNIYAVTVPPDVTKNRMPREVKVPTILTEFIQERIQQADHEQYLFQSDINNVLPYHFKKALPHFELKKSLGLLLHIFRALFRTITIDRGENQKFIDYIMSHSNNNSVGEMYYNAKHLKPQEQFNVFKLFQHYENICNGTVPPLEIDYSKL